MFLAIVWSEVGMVIAKLLLSLSILVILHEFGHYITARWFGCRVEKFYLFFDPWFSVFKKKVGDTEYGIGWLPLGGYVKIAGMVDESMDREQLALPPKPDEFRSKPAWQRLIIMLGGVTVNVLVAFIIYAGILMKWGEKKIYNNSLKYGIEVQDSLMLEFGFKDGDIIKSVDVRTIDNFNDNVARIVVGKNVVVQRGGAEQTIIMPEDLIGQLIDKKRSGVPLLEIRTPFWVGADTGISVSMGVKRFDRVVMVDSVNTPFVADVLLAFEKRKSSIASVVIERDGEQMNMQWQIDSTGMVDRMLIIGKPESLASAGVLKYEVKKYGFFAAFPAGIRMAWDKLGWYVDQFKMILTPKTEAYKGLGGFKAMANVFPKTKWDWESFWNITAFFSIILAFMNLLPIPGLDGGHVLFTLIEMVSGRKPNPKVLEYAQVAGMVFLLALMLYANGNDWFGWGRGR